MADVSSESRHLTDLLLNDVLSHKQRSYQLWGADDLDDSDSGRTDAWQSAIADTAGFLTLSALAHARKRSNWRFLGEIDSSGTAEPEAVDKSNQYQDFSSRLDSRIREYLSFTHDWDGSGASEIPLDAIYASLNFVDQIRNVEGGREPKSAAPSPDGEVVLYWHRPSGYAEVNFDGSGNVSLCWGGGDDDMEFLEEGYENFEVPKESRVWSTLLDFLDQE